MTEQDETKNLDTEMLTGALRLAIRNLQPSSGPEDTESWIARIADAYTALGFVRRPSEDEGVWSITAVKRRTKEFLDRVPQQGQLVVDAKSTAREPIVALRGNDLRLLVDALTRLAGPRFSTGREMYRDIAHDDPPSELAQALRPAVLQPRRPLPARNVAATRDDG